ncbi:MAG: RecX family transcriptional regulator [Myxococcaceae bacterium]|nr:RecX family transcriptional regulator [Myxococcaceae bacterium]
MAALEHAKKLLGARERTEAQLRAALVRKGFGADEIDQAVARLKALGFLDDRRAAEAHARTAFAAKQSRAAVTRKLGALGVAEAEARAAVTRIASEVGQDDELAARALLARRRLTGVKAARFLAGRGFDEALIRRLVPGLDAD